MHAIACDFSFLFNLSDLKKFLAFVCFFQTFFLSFASLSCTVPGLPHSLLTSWLNCDTILQKQYDLQTIRTCICLYCVEKLMFIVGSLKKIGKGRSKKEGNISIFFWKSALKQQ